MRLEEFFSIPVEDQQQYFGKTFFRVNIKPGELVWGWCSGFLHKSIIKFQIEPAGKLEQVNLMEYIPNFDFPDSGLYNLGNSTLYFQKIPKRQAKKGLCSETARFLSFNQGFKDIFLPNRIPEVWRLRQIKSIFESSPKLTLAGGMITFKKRKPISLALDRNFALSLGIMSAKISLWYKQILVGEVISPREIILTPNFFHQEVIDRFLPEGIKINGADI